MTECFCVAGHKVFCKYKPVLDKIKEIAETAPAIDTELSQRILEVIKESEV